MISAVFALLVNVAIAGLFAATFLAALALFKGAPRSVAWLAVAYLVGTLTPASELAIRFTSAHGFFTFTSFATFVSAFLLTAIALARHFKQPVPWAAVGGIGALAICIRVALWDGPRNTMPYELFYQLPFAIATLLCSFIVFRCRPTLRSERAIWIIFAIVSVHFVLKSFAAVWAKSGDTAHAYVTSAYALISKSVTAILLTAVGLILLIDVFRKMLSAATSASEIDVLSGLLNRRGFEAAAEEVIRQASLRPTRQISLLPFDLDHFKRINDTHGHAVGDDVIRRFSELLRENSPSQSICSRIGGEEFVVMIDNCDNAMARMFAESVRSQLEISDRVHIAARTSVGITSSKAQTSLQDLLGQADEALYAAKQAGRNCVRNFQESELAQDNSRVVAGATGA